MSTQPVLGAPRPTETSASSDAGRSNSMAQGLNVMVSEMAKTMMLQVMEDANELDEDDEDD